MLIFHGELCTNAVTDPTSALEQLLACVRLVSLSDYTSRYQADRHLQIWGAGTLLAFPV